MTDLEEKAGILLEFISAIEPLKTVTRHSWCSNGRPESVAEHSWRMAVMALLLEDEFPDIDVNKIVAMSLIHDLGEIAGDIPAFKKTVDDDDDERAQFERLVDNLPEGLATKLSALHCEFTDGSTAEARLANALDKLEAVIQHNEADLSTWEAVEYELNMTYGQDQTDRFPMLKTMRRLAKAQSIRKIQSARPSIERNPAGITGNL